jgi:hypothetical protein
MEATRANVFKRVLLSIGLKSQTQSIEAGGIARRSCCSDRSCDENQSRNNHNGPNYLRNLLRGRRKSLECNPRTDNRHNGQIHDSTDEQNCYETGAAEAAVNSQVQPLSPCSAGIAQGCTVISR